MASVEDEEGVKCFWVTEFTPDGESDGDHSTIPLRQSEEATRGKLGPRARMAKRRKRGLVVRRDYRGGGPASDTGLGAAALGLKVP
jgi:hypothetical protein